MDKGCANCSHAGTPTYKSPCSECVASGTFSGWTARTCENCTNRFLMGLENGPCKACFAGKVYSGWKGSQTCANYTDTCKKCVESGAISGWEARTCKNCRHRYKDGGDEPCNECFDHKMWERMPTDTELAQTAEDMKPDTVNHPAHYTECSLECIDVMLAVFGRKAVTDFCIINAFKYMWRYDHKNGLEDLQKAERYLAMATTFQMGNAEQENRIINMKAELEILMRRVSE